MTGITIVKYNKSNILLSLKILYSKSLGPIERKFHGHSENDGFVYIA